MPRIKRAIDYVDALCLGKEKAKRNMAKNWVNGAFQFSIKNSESVLLIL